MNRSELLKFEGRSVRIEYRTEDLEHSRTGVVYSVTMRMLIFWPFNEDNEQETEIFIPIPDIDDIDYL